MSSSTSGFERAAIVAFLATLAALLVPYESLVRASEQRYGVRRANIASPRTLSPKVDSFLADFRNGVRYEVYATGTSRMEAALIPKVVDPILGPTFNAALGGTSSIATLELFERIGLYPRHILVSVSPMDLTRLGVQRGEKGIGRAQAAANVAAGGPLERRTREAFYTAVHSATPERRRNMGQWAEMWRGGGSVLAFLNNEDAITPPLLESTRGWIPSTAVASEEAMTAGMWTNLPAEYAEGHTEMLARLAALIRRFEERGTRITLVRIPTPEGVRLSEDAQTTFDADVRTLGAEYVDIAERAFTTDRRNFADFEHLNTRGALQFSRALASRLARAERSTPAASASARAPR